MWSMFIEKSLFFSSVDYKRDFYSTSLMHAFYYVAIFSILFLLFLQLKKWFRFFRVFFSLLWWLWHNVPLNYMGTLVSLISHKMSIESAFFHWYFYVFLCFLVLSIQERQNNIETCGGKNRRRFKSNRFGAHTKFWQNHKIKPSLIFQ